MDLMALKYIGVGFMGLGMFGAALGVGIIFYSAVNGIARNPSASDKIQSTAMIGAGLAEAMGLFAFVIAILLIYL